MRHRRTLFTLLIALSTTLWVVSSSADDLDGSWTLNSVEDRPEKVQLSLFMNTSHGSSQSSLSLTKDSFTGLVFPSRGRQNAQFSMTREAGTLSFDGFVDGDNGTGTFRFTPDREFASRLRSLGFDFEEKKQLSMALHDVTIDFAQQMKDRDLENLTAGKLVAFRVHGVSTDFIDDLRAAGQPVKSSSKLVAFRVHGVTAEMVRRLRRSGFEPDDSDLIALRVHGATPDWIDGIAAAGYGDVSLDRLVAFRVHGVSTQFARDINDSGLGPVSAQKLIAFRVHGVTPEFVRAIRSHGLTPDVEEVIAFRIHGVTPEFVDSMFSAGAAFDEDDMIQARIHGITPAMVQKARADGHSEPDLKTIMRIKHSHG